MLQSKQQLLSIMVPNGTYKALSCVRDARDTSVSNLNAALLQSLETASEKTYHCVTARGANYVVQAPNPSVAILKMAVLEERLSSETVRKDDKDAYDLRREARKRNGSDARAELSACYSYIDGRKYGAERHGRELGLVFDCFEKRDGWTFWSRDKKPALPYTPYDMELDRGHYRLTTI